MNKDEGLTESYQQAPIERAADLDVINELIDRNLRQQDVERILAKLSSDDRDLITVRLGELFRKTAALLLTSRRLSDSLSIEVLLSRMVELISDSLDAERCTVFLHDGETDELYTKAAEGAPGGLRIPIGRGIAGAVFRTGRPVLAPDAHADPRFDPEVDELAGQRTRNVLCVPLRHLRDGKVRIVGVAEVLNKRSGGFSDDDRKLLDNLNVQAVAVLVKALLHEEVEKARAEQLQLLEVTTALTQEIELHPLLSKILSGVAGILDADRATLFAHDTKTGELWALAGPEQGQSPSHIEIAGEVFASGRAINIRDPYSDARFVAELDRRAGQVTRSILCAPVFNREGKVIAVAEVVNKRGGPFTRADERRLAAFSAQAAIALENARLFDELNQNVRDLKSLLEASKALAAAVDLDSQLEAILARATEVMEAERSSLFIYDAASQTLCNRATGALSKGQLRIPVGVGIAGHVARTGELLNIPDAYQDPRFNPEVDKETGFRTRSILCAPMFTHSGKLIGVLQVLNKRDAGVFARRDEALLQAFASHAAIALDRASLVDASLEKERIEESLRLAHDIQMGMLPTRFPSRREFELHARLSPAKSVGGDLYDFVAAADRLWFIVGDVSGKGVSAALFMAVTKTLFRATVQAGVSPSAALSRMNHELSQDNERAMFVSAFAGCLELRTGELEFANAGHNPPYLLGADGSVAAVTQSHGMALGIVGDYAYLAGRLRLAPGEGLFLYTDGVPEAQDGNREQFSAARLEAYLKSVATAPTAQIVEGCFATVQAFVGDAPQFDDIAVMSFRYRSA